MCNVNDKVKCVWCEKDFSESDVVKEEKLGVLCDWCVKGIESKGEKLEIIE